MLVLMLSLTATTAAMAPAAAQTAHRLSAPVVRIAFEEAGTPVIGRVRFATLRNDGGVVIADDAESMLHWYDADGRYLRSAGRPGAGPGEFRSIDWIGRCAPDELAAFDPVQGRVSFFTDAGEYKRQRNVPGVQAVYGCGSAGDLVALRADQSTPGTMRGSLVRIGQSGTSDVVARGLVVRQQLLLGAELRVGAAGGAIAFGSGDSATITVISPSQAPPRRAQAGISGRKTSPSHRTAAIEQLAHLFLGTAADHARMREVYSRLPSASNLPAYSGVFLDDATQTIWVNRSPPGSAETELERRTSSGGLTGLVVLPLELRPFAVHNNRLVALTEDASAGVQELLIFDLPN